MRQRIEESKVGEAYSITMLAFYDLRHKLFPRFYAWQQKRRAQKDMIVKFGRVLYTGDYVEDCRGEVHRIHAIEADSDTVILDDGFGCSLSACCDLPPAESR